jgi:histone H3/H4
MVKDFPLLPLEKIAREAGAERVSHSALIAMKEVLLEMSEGLAHEAVKLTEHAKRVTVKREDIILASKR